MHTGPENRKSPSITSLIAFAMIIFGGYLLSPGLLVPLDNAGYLDDDNALTEFIEVFYWPVEWCYDNVDWVESFYDAYFEMLGD
jgi:hypothetical protein